MISSVTSDVQKILVELSTPDVAIEPGSVRQLQVTMTNRQDIPDRLSLEIEGIDVEWYSMPEPAFYVAPGAQATARINFKVARVSGNLAGVYPFLVRVQGMETGETGVAQATLIIQPYRSLQLELSPKRAVATYFNRYNDFEVTLSNLGNAEETLDLFASDPEDGCAYEFDTERITLKPSQTNGVLLGVSPKSSAVLGGMRLYGFTVTARSVNDSIVSTSAHGQLEKRALISPLLGIFLLLLISGIGGYFTFRPAPPQPIVINAFDADQKHIHGGDKAILTWNVQPADSQVVLSYHVGSNPTEIYDPGPQTKLIGSVSVTPQIPLTVYTLRVTSHGKSQSRQIRIEVAAPPAPPKPTIKYFTVSPGTIHVGDPILLSWEVKNAKDLIIEPGYIKLEPFEQTRTLNPTEDTVYKLIAVGLSDKYTPPTKTVSVHVAPKDVCIAEVKFFGPRGTVYIGDHARLSWRTHYAATARIDADHGVVGSVTPGTGSIETTVTEPTTYIMTVTDSLGNKATQSLTITPKPRPVIPAPVQTPPTETTQPPTGDNPTPPTTGNGTPPP